MANFLLTEYGIIYYSLLLFVIKRFFCQSGNNSVVECNLAKVEVASSNLVSRSIEFSRFGPGSDLFSLSSFLFFLTGLRLENENLLYPNG